MDFMRVSCPNILRIDASMRLEGSISRLLADITISNLSKNLPEVSVISRDLRLGVGHVSSLWREASIETLSSRSPEDRAILAQSEAMVEEVNRADIIVMAVPIYNFCIPAALKAWVDMICRNNVDGAAASFKPQPIQTKQALIILTSNHTLAGSKDDFASNFLHHILSFIGCSEIHQIDATGLADNKANVLASAHQKVQSICQAVVSQELSTAAE